METRNILNSQEQVIGTLTLPEGTAESIWQEKMGSFSATAQELAARSLTISVKDRKLYADDLIERFKKKNISEGINGLQAMKMQEKSKRITWTFMGVTGELDIINCAVTGDIECAILALQNCTNIDDMSLPYHWMNQERVNWLVADMKAFLGWA